MKKRILSLCMVLVLCLGLLPTTVLAADGDTVYVGGVALTCSESTPVYATTNESGEVKIEGADENNYNIKWDGSTLTLDGAKIKGSTSSESLYATVGIYAFSNSGDVSLNIALKGVNEIFESSNGIWVYSSSANAGAVTLTIEGEGSLNASGSSSGILVQSNSGDATLTIQNADVTAENSSSSFDGVTVRAGSSSSASLSVDGGSLTATGKNESGAGIRYIFGSSSFGSGKPSLTVSGNAMVKASGGEGGISDNSSTDIQIGVGDNSSGGIVFDGNTGTVYGNVTLQDDLTIGEGESLTLNDGARLAANGYNVIVDGGIVDEGIENSLADSMKYTPTITTTSLPDGTVGTGYSTTLAADGTAPITWSVDSDSLPAGLSLDASTGVISGTPTAEGGSMFTVTAANDYGFDSKEFTLSIDKPVVIPVTGVKLDKTSLTLQETDSATLIATVDPDNATNKNVNWESSDTSIATVDASGKVTAISAGNATITAAAADGSGKSASCSVTVTHGNMVHTPKKDATCTADGNEEYWTCETCGKIFSDAEGKTEIKLSDTVIPATGHNLIKTEANKATVDASGNIEYWYCSDCEKYFKDEKGEHEITLDETVIAKLPKLLSGANAEWSKGKKEGLTFSVDANISDFIGVKVDQKELDPSMYEVRSGSTIITLKPSYLESLSSGKHEIRMEFKSGTIQTYFTIKKGSDSQTPETGQQTNLYMWIGLLVASALILGFIGWKRRSK